MSDLVLGSTTVLSDSSGTPTIQSGVGFDSGINLPAGNVINIEVKQFPSTASETITTTDSAIGNFEFTYVVKKQTSKLYVAAYPLIQTEHDGTDYSFVFSLRSSVDSYASAIGNAGTPQIVHYGSTAQSQWLQYPVIISCFHDHNQTAGTTITYKIYGHSKSNSRGIYGWDTWGHTTSTGAPTVTHHAVIYEVAQ